MDVDESTEKKESNFLNYEFLYKQTPDHLLFTLIEKINSQQKEINGLWRKIRFLERKKH